MFNSRIVTIHAVSEGTFSPNRLERYIKTIRALGYSFVSIHEIMKKKGENGQIALTFDDSYRSTFTNAIPILKKYNVPALMFVPTGLLGYPANHPILMKHECYKNEATMSVDEVNQWIEEGFDVGFHTHEHIDMYEVSEQVINNDFVKGMTVLTQNGWRTTYFAYPKGFLPHNRPMFENLLRQYGFKYAFTINHGDLNVDKRFYINRICLGNKEPFFWCILKTIGFFADWYFRKRKQHIQQVI